MDEPGGFPADLECVQEHRQAETLLHPLRLRILRIAQEPASASDIARQLRMPRQRVNYHVRRLAEQGLLRRAGRQRKRNMVEQRFVASARTFVLAPSILGPLEANWRAVRDTGGSEYLLALCAEVLSDLSRLAKAESEPGARPSMFSLKSQFRFERPEQRAEFARALRQAVVEVIARHTTIDETSEGRPTRGRSYRLLLGCYPFAPSEPR